MICLLLSCGKRPASVTTEETAPLPVNLNTIDVDKVLDDWGSIVESYPEKDSIFYPLGYTTMEEDTSRLIAVGRFIDGKMLNAVDISAPDEGVATFYAYRKHKWEKIGQYPIENNVYSLEFEDYDGDGQNEIKARGASNMNGNYSNYFYSYSGKENKVNYAGNFYSGQFEMQTRNGEERINVNYEGSWYMDQEKTVYRWHEGKLLPLKQVVLSLKKADMKHHAHFISYYENPTTDKDTIVLQFRKNYSERNKKLNDLWEHFFD